MSRLRIAIGINVALFALSAAIWSTQAQAHEYAGGDLPFGTPCETAAIDVAVNAGFDQDLEAHYEETHDRVPRDLAFERSCIESAIPYVVAGAFTSGIAITVLGASVASALSRRRGRASAMLIGESSDS